jgi:type II secretory pathway pseudopilin PulG
MIGRLRDEAGFTIPELLISMSVMLTVLTGTLLTFTEFETTTTRNATQNDSQEMARRTMTGLARQLRNLAGPDEGQPRAFDKIDPHDIVFLTVNPQGPPAGENVTNVQRVRYCVDHASGKLWVQKQTWLSRDPPGVPGTGGCPDDSWGNKTLGAENVVNGAARPTFLFDSADARAVSQVRSDVFVDVNPNQRPGETHLQSGVFLRNQNRSPTASFQWAPGNAGHVILNASASSDPEGQALTFTWKEGEIKLEKGETVVFDWQTTPGQHAVTLEVRDPAGLIATQTQTVTVPGEASG